MISRNAAGYTIIEVLIVLAVTGAMLMAAIITMSGRQASTEFTQGLRDLESRVQATASEVASGFPGGSISGFNCVKSGAGIAFPLGSAGAGANKDCIFLGKVMQFGQTGGRDIYTFTIVGLRLGNGTSNVTQLANAAPTPVAEVTGPDVTSVEATKWGVKVTRIMEIGGGDIGAFGYINDLSGDIGAGTSVSGTRGARLYAIRSVTLGEGKPTIIPKLKNAAATNYALAANGIMICVKGTNGKRAEIDVGGSRGDQTTNVIVDPGVSNACPA